MSNLVAHDHRMAATRRYAPFAHLVAWLMPYSLDTSLARGVDPASTRALTLRAEKLTSRDFRDSVANSLDRAVRSAEGARPAFTAAVPVARDEVRDAFLAFAALTERLRSRLPADPRGVAMARMLLADAGSPLYSVSPDTGELDRAVQAATDALESRQ